MDMRFDSMTTFIASAGALGTAAFGLVEALKGITPLGTAGIGKLKQSLGTDVERALDSVYGPGAWELVLKGAYREGAEATSSLLRTGLRMALEGPYGASVALSLGLDKDTVQKALRTYAEGADAGGLDAARKDMARVELALDARIRGAVALAGDARVASLQLAAALVAIVGALLVGTVVAASRGSQAWHAELGYALLLGVMAVPFAPISKDLVSFLQSAKSALTRRGA